MILYMKTSKDDLETPIAVADTIMQLAKMTGNSYVGLRSTFSRIRNGKQPQNIWRIVNVPDYEKDEDW